MIELQECISTEKKMTQIKDQNISHLNEQLLWKQRNLSELEKQKNEEISTLKMQVEELSKQDIPHLSSHSEEKGKAPEMQLKIIKDGI